MAKINQCEFTNYIKLRQTILQITNYILTTFVYCQSPENITLNYSLTIIKQNTKHPSASQNLASHLKITTNKPSNKRQKNIQNILSLIIYHHREFYQKDKSKIIPYTKQMFSFILIVYQLLFVLMIGVFYRSSTFDSANSHYVTFGLVTILGFVLMNATYRKLSLFSLVLLIFTSFLAIQTNLMFMAFWSSCFTSFAKQLNIGTGLLINSVYAALAVIITSMDFLGLFQYWQVFALISFLMTIGYGLSSALILYGLDTFDGGSGISVFLYSGVCSLMIWLLCVRGKISILQHKKSQSYVNYTLGLIGVSIAFFSWPVLNAGGSTVSFINTSLTSSLSLSNSAYVNTISALGVSLIMVSVLSSHDTQSQKLKPKVFIQCFINAGIIVSSYSDISLHPVVGMILALVSTILTLLVDKYLVAKTDVRNESDFKMVLLKFSKIIFRIVWSFVGVCVGAIVLKTRESSSLGILTASGAYGQKAGLMVAGWIIVLIIGIIFGGLCSLSINFYLNYRSPPNQAQKFTQIVDELFFQQLQSQIFPIYKDILEVQPDKTYEQDLTRRMLHESLMQQQKIPINIYETNKVNTNHETNESRNIQKQTIVIKNDFSKSNLQKKDFNLSAMKNNKNEQPIAVQNVHVSRQKNSTRQRINVENSPIDLLKGRESRFESFRPSQSIAQNPRQMRTIPSSSRLVQIHVIEEQSTDKKLSASKQAEQGLVRKKLTFGVEDPIEEQQIAGQNINRVNS